MNAIHSACRELMTVLLFAVVCCSPARGDWCHGGEVPSVEWLVDASNVVVAKVVEKPDDYSMYRVTEILKRSKQFTMKVGDVIEGKPRWRWTNGSWKQGEPLVMFLGNDKTVTRSVVNLIRPTDYNDRNEAEVTRVQVWDLENGQLTDEPTAGEWLMHGVWKSSRIVLERDPGEASLRAESGNGRLQAEVVPGMPQRLVICEAESQKVVCRVELNGMIRARDVYFTNSGDSVLLVLSRHDARMFPADADKPLPTWFGSCQ